MGNGGRLVNNAGINVPRLLVDPAGKEELTEEIWDKVFAVNVKGQFLCAQAAARQMLASGRGGCLSICHPNPGWKGVRDKAFMQRRRRRIQNMTRSWAKELGDQGVRIVGVAPGIMETTGMRSESYEASLAYTRGISVEDLRAKYGSTSSIPLGRSGKLSEVADLGGFLGIRASVLFAWNDDQPLRRKIERLDPRRKLSQLPSGDSLGENQVGVNSEYHQS